VTGAELEHIASHVARVDWPTPAEPLPVARAVIDELGLTHEGTLILRHWRGDFIAWSAGVWGEVEESAMRSTIYLRLEAAEYTGESGRSAKWAPTRRKVADVVAALEALTFLNGLEEPPTWLDGSHREAAEYVSVRNGILHLPTRQLCQHTPSLFNTVRAEVDFDPQALAPRWASFLDDLFGDDEESKHLLQEWFGYVVSGRTHLHKALLIVGPTRAGKGVILRVLTALVGAGNTASVSLADLGRNFGLMPLVAKTLAVVPDARLAGRGAGSVVERLLAITGGDMVTVDRKNREPWVGTLGARFTICSNELPRLADASSAVANRLRVLQLTRSWLGREDASLEDALATELPGILNWALHGLERLSDTGRLTEPAASASAATALRELSSPLEEFVSGMCDIGRGLSVRKDALYAAWRRWCLDRGEDPSTDAILGRDLRAAYPEEIGEERPRIPGSDERPRLYTGITLRHTAPREVRL